MGMKADSWDWVKEGRGQARLAEITLVGWEKMERVEKRRRMKIKRERISRRRRKAMMLVMIFCCGALSVYE